MQILSLREISLKHLKSSKRALPDTMELVEPDSFHGGKAFYDFTPRIIYKKAVCIQTVIKWTTMMEN